MEEVCELSFPVLQNYIGAGSFLYFFFLFCRNRFVGSHTSSANTAVDILKIRWSWEGRHKSGHHACNILAVLYSGNVIRFVLFLSVFWCWKIFIINNSLYFINFLLFCLLMNLYLTEWWDYCITFSCVDKKTRRLRKWTVMQSSVFESSEKLSGFMILASLVLYPQLWSILNLFLDCLSQVPVVLLGCIIT